MKENSMSYRTAKQETERLICEIEEMTITHRAYTAECLRRVLKENEEYKKAIDVVNKEKADWIKAYQEEKDKQFDLINKISSNDFIQKQIKQAMKTLETINTTDYHKREYNQMQINKAYNILDKLNSELKGGTNDRKRC